MKKLYQIKILQELLNKYNFIIFCQNIKKKEKKKKIKNIFLKKLNFNLFVGDIFIIYNLNFIEIKTNLKNILGFLIKNKKGILFLYTLNKYNNLLPYLKNNNLKDLLIVIQSISEISIKQIENITKN